MNPELPLISIVTPTLNAAAFIAHCLANVRDQGYALLEHIVVDGGSSDATLEIARSHPAVRVLELAGLNQSQAINAGLRIATGEVVAWLNADDRYASGALARVADRFAADPSLEALYGDCDVVDAHDRFLWREVPGPYDYERLLRRGNYLAQPATFLRKGLLGRVGYLDESFEYGMDYELWLRLRGSRIEYLPHVLATFRWHPDSKTALNQWGNWREMIQVMRSHGGGWSPRLAWTFSRMLLTVGRIRAERMLLARLGR